uniref:Cytochrome b5 n=1 Tax=Aceria tosichella TaxID=561515 RepID=A0A6G1S967_9ACAR
MTQTITLEEVQKHTTRNSVWFVIHNKVYDVTKFMDEHPGGEEVLLEQAGKNATEIFEDVSHSADAKDLMKNYLVGELPEHERTAEKTEKTTTSTKISKNFDDADHSLSLTWMQWGITIGVSAIVGLLVRHWLGSS